MRHTQGVAGGDGVRVGAAKPLDRRARFYLEALDLSEPEDELVGQSVGLVFQVVDDRAKPKPVEGQLVNFVVVSGGGSVFAGAALTNADGIAQNYWGLGDPGPQRLETRPLEGACEVVLTPPLLPWRARGNDLGMCTATIAAAGRASAIDPRRGAGPVPTTRR